MNQVILKLSRCALSHIQRTAPWQITTLEKNLNAKYNSSSLFGGVLGRWRCEN